MKTAATTLLMCLAVSASAIYAHPGKGPRQGISPYNASVVSMHARDYYQSHWGVDSLVVKSLPADQLIRFSYRVVDPAKAAALAAKEASPQLFDEKSHVSLVVPTMDKIGQLRQSGPPEAGKTYWMVFSNKGNLVRPGHRVGVLIGPFRATGLAVQ
jgi:hypothetical protein